MPSVIVILLVTLLIIVYEVPSLIRRKLNRELWTFSIILAIAITLNIVNRLGIIIPTPLDLLSSIYKPINNLLFR